MFKIALAQINPTVGDLARNTRKIIVAIGQAKRRKAEIVVFPELVLCGYPPEDLLNKKHFLRRNQQFLKKLCKAAKGITVIVGFPHLEGKNIYNAAAVIQDGGVSDIYRKIALPNYGVFDEKRYFNSGNALTVYKLGEYTFGLTICEDIWHGALVKQLKGQKLDFIVNISASPFHAEKEILRDKILSAVARELKGFVFYCNIIGGQDELVFDGGSRVISKQGYLVTAAKRFSEDLLIFDFNPKKHYPAKKANLKDDWEVFSALKLGLADYVSKNGFKKVILGMSGGIDSAVVAGLAVMALGKQNVSGLIMPSPYTSAATFRDAKEICHNLGIKYSIVDIKHIITAYAKGLAPDFRGRRPDVTEENLQARIRGNILMAFSNKFGYLVLNTGNKSEVSCGYCTLYGDMVGGFGILKDVPKLIVYKLAQQINQVFGKKVIPDTVIKRPPTAELKVNQKDTDTLPAYKLLDPILKLYVEEDLSLAEIVRRGYKPETVKRVMRMVDSSEYKRRQATIGIKITPRAFGRDRRMPVTNKFNET